MRYVTRYSSIFRNPILLLGNEVLTVDVDSEIFRKVI